MNSSPEQFEQPRENDEKMIKEKAIEIYLKLIYSFVNEGVSENEEKYIKDKAKAYSKHLEPFEDGLRFGAPGYPHAKLKTDREENTEEIIFYIDSNGMKKNSFLKWQKYVNEKFMENGLKFRNKKE